MASADEREAALSVDDDSSADGGISEVGSTSTTASCPPSPSSVDGHAPLHAPHQSSSSSSLTPHKPSVVMSSPSYAYSLCLLYAFCVMGFDMALLGPSLLQLAAQSGTSIFAMSFVFAARSAGLLTGTLIAGWLIDRYPGRGNLLLCTGTGLMLVWTIVFPFVPNVYSLVLFGYIHGIMMGLIDNTCQVLLIRHHGVKVAPWMQALHFAFGAGSFLSPLILSPFLTGGSTDDTVDGDLVVYDPTFHYAWIITAMGGLPCTLWMVYYTKKIDFSPTALPPLLSPLPSPSSAEDDEPVDDSPWHEAGQQQSVIDAASAKAEYRFQLKVVLNVGFFLTLYVGCETGYGAYIFSYAVTQLGASSDAAAYLNSGYWGSFALGRLAGVPISLYFTPQQMVVSDLVGCIVAVAINLAFVQSFTALWLGTLLYGFSVGSVYASAINYTEHLVGVNGRLLSYLTFFAALGDAVIPLTIGSLFGTTVGPRGMMYVTVAVAALATAVFAFLITCIAGEMRGKNKIRHDERRRLEEEEEKNNRHTAGEVELTQHQLAEEDEQVDLVDDEHADSDGPQYT